MKLVRRKRSTTFALNMTPMIDCVFLLLIFFMTCSQIALVNDESIPLPPEKGSRDKELSTITINVLDDGEIRIAGESRTLTDVVDLVSRELKSHDNEPAALSISLRAHKDGRSRTVNEIVRALNRLGIAGIHLSVDASS